jgi:hypothetical protein
VAQILMQYDDRILGGSGAHILQERMVLNLSTEIPQHEQIGKHLGREQ